MLLAIDCGNTNTVFSIWNGAEFVATWRTSTEWQRTADQYYVWLSTLMKMRGIEAEIDGKHIERESALVEQRKEAGCIILGRHVGAG